MMRFWVECCRDGEWKRVAFVESNSVQYCHGWLDCAESVLPHREYRLCKRINSGEVKVLREVKAGGARTYQLSIGTVLAGARPSGASPDDATAMPQSPLGIVSQLFSNGQY